MDLTGTKNRRLAQALCVDPSLICRFRNGQRQIPAQSDYISEIAAYFSVRCYETDCTGLLEQVAVNYLDPVSDIRTMLERWLSEADQVPITELLGRQPAPKARKAAPFRSFSGPDAWTAAIDAFSSYLQAAPRGGRIKLLQQTVLPTAQARAAFNRQLTAAILPVLQRGGTAIRVMPQVSTLTAESENAHHWLPLLLTGNLQLFEYDGLQENALQTDLIVFSGVAALQSLRAAGETKVTVQLTTDPFVVAGLETTLDTYLIACRPVSKISGFPRLHYPADPASPTPSSLMHVYASLPSSSVPEKFFREERQEPALSSDAAIFCKWQCERLLLAAEQQPVTELFPLLTAEEVLAGKALPATDLAREAQAQCYSPKYYAQQLAMIVQLLQTTRNYHVCLLPPGETQSNFCFFGPSQMTMFPLRNVTGMQLMTVSHSGTVQALQQKYASIVRAAQADASYRAQVIETLQRLQEELETAVAQMPQDED